MNGLYKKFCKNKTLDNSVRGGIVCNEVPQMSLQHKGLFSILLNGLLNAAITISTLLCFIDSFNIKCYSAMIIISLLMLCVYFATFYVNKVLRFSGYLIVLASFFGGIIMYHRLIRGGFGIIANKFMEVIEKELDLPIEKRYSEYVVDKVTATTICVIFLGFSIALIFNIVITEAKGFALVFLFTFPIIQLGMYFDKKINVAYFVVYMISITALMILRTSSHYKIETNKKKGYVGNHKKNIIIYDYVSENKNSFAIFTSIIVISIIISCLISIIVPRVSFRMDEKFMQWKKSTESTAKRIALVGFWGMLNPDGSAVGGVGRNSLGDVNYIKLDFQTDINVLTYVVPDETSIYLRANAGTYYENNSWKYISEHHSEKYKSLESYGLTGKDVASLNSRIIGLDTKDSYHNYCKYIKVYNIDANSDYLYMNANANGIEEITKNQKYDDEWNGKLLKGEGIEYFYFSLKEDMKLNDLQAAAADVKSSYMADDRADDLYEIERKYSKYVKNTYLDVPQKNSKVIQKIFKENGIDNSEGLNSVYKVIKYLDDNYKYSLIPGKTPANKDFVNYFLTKNKKGYCSYFASSAVLMFRELGIPARFVGGYSVSTTDMDNMSRNMKDSKFKSIIGKNAQDAIKYSINVNDSSAHAWTEVYVDNLGWVPVEVTPSVDETETDEKESTGTLLNIVQQIFSPQMANAVKNTSLGILKTAVLLTVLSVIILFFVGIIIRKGRRANLDIDKNLIYLKKMLKIADIEWNEQTSYDGLRLLLLKYNICTESQGESLVNIVECKKYSQAGIDISKQKIVHKIILDIGMNIYSRLSLFKKIKYKYIKCLI